MRKAIHCAVYRVPACPGCQAKPGHCCTSKNGLEYPYAHLSRRHAAARIAGIEPRNHFLLLRVSAESTQKQHEFIVSEIARTGDKSGTTTLRIYGQIARGEMT